VISSLQPFLGGKMETQMASSGRGRKNLGSLKEGLSDIRDRIEAKNGVIRRVGWKKIFSLATAVGAIGAVALSRRYFRKGRVTKR